MNEKNSDDSTKHVPIRDLKMEPEAEEMNLALAMMGRKDTGPAVEKLAELPLVKRYVWRVASALKRAFADFDTLTVEADRQTLPTEDKKRLVDLLEHRPLQFCMFQSALLGQKHKELMMLSAIKNSRVIVADSEGHE